MELERLTLEYFASIKKQILEELRPEIRRVVTTEIDQQRLTVSEASRFTGMSEDTIYTLCREKKIPHYRVGGEKSTKPKILFRIESLERWMEQQERENCPGWR